MAGDLDTLAGTDAAALRAALIALVDFHVASGCDLALEEMPVDRFAEEAQRRAAAEADREASRAQARTLIARGAPAARDASPASPAIAPATLDPAAAASEARALAASARDLAELAALVDAFQGCPLRASARRTVFADGTPGARVMLIGETPGAEEDREGRPFVGRAGRLLEKMLAAIGLSRSDVYIANVIPWRSPGGQKPAPHHVSVCHPFLQRQIELAQPDLLVSLGRLPAESLLDARGTIMQLRGRWLAYDVAGRAIPMLITLDPGHLLKHPKSKAHAWKDLRALRTRLAETPRAGALMTP